MIMWALLFALGIAQVCDFNKNDEQNINEDCNYAGMCFGNKCYCCDSIAENDYCQGTVPGTWTGDTCSQATFYTQVSWAYLFEGNEVTCSNNGASSASPDLLSETSEILLVHYHGIVVTLPCEICTPENPCDFFYEEPIADSGVMAKFGTDINTYYDPSCASDTLPESIIRCDENYDNGALAWKRINDALDSDNGYNQLITDLQTVISSSGTYGLSRVWSEDIQILYTSTQTSRLPTPSPTLKPIVVEAPCTEYVNSVDDLHFLGVGSSCRANINVSWIGGQTCNSPYIVCLPEENTPANDIMGVPYKSNNHDYTVDECVQECSYDQRCLGVEFIAKFGTNVGDCNLIDDIPVVVENEVSTYTYSSSDSVLDSSVTGGDALCWSKVDYCNPHFEAEDLNDDMLNCYCPNNRKGFYTKKVKRTLSNSRFCGSDPNEDQQIQKAQANRMFHLCENWCLFETENPERKSWYWDPWQTCWRETYSGTGEHRSYCDRVIRNPNSIEMKFLNYRSENFLSESCGMTRSPTSSPLPDSYIWTLSGFEENCDDACEKLSNTCAEEPTAHVMSEAELKNVFSEAGKTCEDGNIIMVDESYDGFALPGLFYSSLCVARQETLSNLEYLDTDCSRVLGARWQRLCACYE